MQPNEKWVGRRVLRAEDVGLLTGRGTFADDLSFPHLSHAAILRSPHAHARLASIDAAPARAHPGVHGVLTGPEIARLTRPFPAGMPTKLDYFSAAADKVRYVGEPVAVVVAESRYVAEDACELIEVGYEPLPAVVDAEVAMGVDAPLLHEKVGTNLVNHRRLRYGDVDSAFAEADVIVRRKFRFHRYSSTPIETCVAIATHQPATGVFTIWSNFHGPYALHSFVAKGLGVPENKLRLIAPPDIGGSFGIKIGITPYLVLIAVAARATGRTVKWVEDRREHLMALSSGAERTAYYELAARGDGTILAVRSRYIDNNGAYIRAPEPASLYRTTGNTTGPYRIRAVEIDANAVLTNKSPTGPNRGYGCQQLYYCLERMVDVLARELDLEPAEVRRRNLIHSGEFPYRTVTGGVYDSGDYAAGLREALRLADYEELRRRQSQARREGRLVGIGIGVGVEPGVSNMGYLNLAYPPVEREREGFHTKSGAGEGATLKVDPMGRITAVLGSAPSGQGHDLLVAQVVADELGVTPDDITVVGEMDTFTRPWTISSGNYSSRFASAGLSAFAEAARRLRQKILSIAAHRLEVEPRDLVMEGGRVVHRREPARALEMRQIAGIAHWNPSALPKGMEAGLQVSHIFNYTPARPIDSGDHVNSSNTYGFIAEVVAVELDRETGEVEIVKFVSVHDAGVIINPQRVDGQVCGGVLHGLGGALYEELVYDEAGQFLSGSFLDYPCPTAVEAPPIVIGHVCTPSTLSVLGTKGCGEGSAMTAPAAIANAVNDALQPLGVSIDQLPLTPPTVWAAIRSADRAPPEVDAVGVRESVGSTG